MADGFRGMALRSRPKRGRLAILTMVWTQACVVAQPLAHEAAPESSDVRIHADPPVALTSPGSAGLTSRPLCMISHVEGRVARQVGDTLLLTGEVRSTPVIIANSGRSARESMCPLADSVTLVRSDRVSVTELKVSGSRTAALVLGSAAVFVAFAAWAASQIDVGGLSLEGAPVR